MDKFEALSIQNKMLPNVVIRFGVFEIVASDCGLILLVAVQSDKSDEFFNETISSDSCILLRSWFKLENEAELWSVNSDLLMDGGAVGAIRATLAILCTDSNLGNVTFWVWIVWTVGACDLINKFGWLLSSIKSLIIRGPEKIKSFSGIGFLSNFFFKK